MKYIDPQGDTILLSTTGYILKNNQQDNIVAVSFENGIKGVGSLGKEVDIYSIFSNLIDEYSSSAVLMNPFKLRGLVQNRGEWDLKNNKNTIYGLGNDGKTKFIFGEYPVMESQDVGNMHFGIVTKANIFISEDFALKKAGSAQISAGTSRPEWQIFKETVTWSGGYRTVIKTMLPPYGDDPRDLYWIKQGFNYYKNKE